MCTYMLHICIYMHIRRWHHRMAKFTTYPVCHDYLFAKTPVLSKAGIFLFKNLFQMIWQGLTHPLILPMPKRNWGTTLMPSLTSHGRPNKSCLFNLSGAVAIPCPGWQKLAGFRRTQKMPSILSSDAYFLLICDKRRCFFAYIQNCNKKGIFYLVLPSVYLVLPSSY